MTLGNDAVGEKAQASGPFLLSSTRSTDSPRVTLLILTIMYRFECAERIRKSELAGVGRYGSLVAPQASSGPLQAGIHLMIKHHFTSPAGPSQPTDRRLLHKVFTQLVGTT